MKTFGKTLVAAWLLASCADDGEISQKTNGELTTWFLSGAAQQNYRVSLDARVRHGGGASGRLEWIAGDPEAGAGTLMQSTPAAPYRQKRVRFSAWVRTDGVSGWAGLWMRVDRELGRAVFDNMQGRPLGGNLEWAEHSIVLDVPEDATAISFGLMQNGRGTSWIDDASIETVGRDVATTEIDPRPASLQGGGFEIESGLWMRAGVARDDFETKLDQSIVHGGAASMHLTSVVEQPRGHAQIEQVVRADAYRDKRVRVTAWVRGEALQTYGGMSVLVLGPNAPPTSPGLNSAGFYNNGTFDWSRFELVLDVPPEADSLVIGFGTKSRGKLWIDDVAMEEVGRDVPVSNTGGGPQELTNRTLDEGTSASPDEPAGWWISGGARSHYIAKLDRDIWHEGGASARFEPSVAEPQGYGTLMQRFTARSLRDKRVRITAFVRGKDVDQRGDLWLRVQAVDSPGDGGGLGGGGCQLSGTFDWKPCTVVFDVPAHGHAIDLGVGTTGHGTIWLDDVRVEEVGLDVPLTHPRDTEPRSLQNGEFDLDAKTASNAPRGWFLSGGGRDDFAATVDGGAARLEARTVPARGYGTLMQSVRATDYIGKRMKLRARVRATDIEQGDVWLRVQSPNSPGDGPGLGGGSCALEGTFDWKPCEIVFDVPESASLVQVGAGIRGKGEGTIWLDDVVLEEVDRGVRPTEVVRDRKGPENLDFEG